MTTPYVEFLELVGEVNPRPTESTLRLWHVIHDWVASHGYADTADSPDFVAHMAAFREGSVATLNRHLARMTEAGLLKRHRLRRKLPPEAIEEAMAANLMFFTGGVESLPTALNRFVLPGQPCPREFKSAQRLGETINRRVKDFQERQKLVPTPPTTS